MQSILPASIVLHLAVSAIHRVTALHAFQVTIYTKIHVSMILLFAKLMAIMLQGIFAMHVSSLALLAG